MKKMFHIAILLLMSMSLFAQNYSVDLKDLECRDAELDGSVTVKSWAIGRNGIDASEQARKNAVYAAIFYGFRSCGIKPLVNEVGADEKYDYFFNVFFKDNGDYRQFSSIRDKRAFSKERLREKDQVKVGFVVRVKRGELKAYLVEHGIIKP